MAAMNRMSTRRAICLAWGATSYSSSGVDRKRRWTHAAHARRAIALERLETTLVLCEFFGKSFGPTYMRQ